MFCLKESCEPCDGNRICNIFCVGQTSFGSTNHQFGTNCKAFWSRNVNCSCRGNYCILSPKECTDLVLKDLCANRARCFGHFPRNVYKMVRCNAWKSSGFCWHGKEWGEELTGNTWHVRWKAGKRKETNVKTCKMLCNHSTSCVMPVSHCLELGLKNFLRRHTKYFRPQWDYCLSLFSEAVKQYHRWSQRNTIKNTAPCSTLLSSHPPIPYTAAGFLTAAPGVWTSTLCNLDLSNWFLKRLP